MTKKMNFAWDHGLFHFIEEYFGNFDVLGSVFIKENIIFLSLELYNENYKNFLLRLYYFSQKDASCLKFSKVMLGFSLFLEVV